MATPRYSFIVADAIPPTIITIPITSFHSVLEIIPAIVVNVPNEPNRKARATRMACVLLDSPLVVADMIQNIMNRLIRSVYYKQHNNHLIHPIRLV